MAWKLSAPSVGLLDEKVVSHSIVSPWSCLCFRYSIITQPFWAWNYLYPSMFLIIPTNRSPRQVVVGHRPLRSLADRGTSTASPPEAAAAKKLKEMLAKEKPVPWMGQITSHCSGFFFGNWKLLFADFPGGGGWGLFFFWGKSFNVMIIIVLFQNFANWVVWLEESASSDGSQVDLTGTDCTGCARISELWGNWNLKTTSFLEAAGKQNWAHFVCRPCQGGFLAWTRPCHATLSRKRQAPVPLRQWRWWHGLASLQTMLQLQRVQVGWISLWLRCSWGWKFVDEGPLCRRHSTSASFSGNSI